MSEEPAGRSSQGWDTPGLLGLQSWWQVVWANTEDSGPHTAALCSLMVPALGCCIICSLTYVLPVLLLTDLGECQPTRGWDFTVCSLGSSARYSDVRYRVNFDLWLGSMEFLVFLFYHSGLWVCEPDLVFVPQWIESKLSSFSPDILETERKASPSEAQPLSHSPWESVPGQSHSLSSVLALFQDCQKKLRTDMVQWCPSPVFLSSK
jgi:hypothetical protein